MHPNRIDLHFLLSMKWLFRMFSILDCINLLLLLCHSIVLRALRRLWFASIYDTFAIFVDGRCFLNGLVTSRRSSSLCVIDNSDKNEHVELISFPFGSSPKRFEFSFRLRNDAFKFDNVSRTFMFISWPVCKKSHTVDNFSSWNTCTLNGLEWVSRYRINIKILLAFHLPIVDALYFRIPIIVVHAAISSRNWTVPVCIHRISIAFCRAHVANAVLPQWSLAIACGSLVWFQGNDGILHFLERKIHEVFTLSVWLSI